MDQQSWLTERFEENRTRLRGVAYRMLGSRTEAEDAVQEAWLRLNGVDPASIENLGGWLTTVVSRVCLDMLRGRKLRREDSMGAQVTEPRVVRGEGADPEGEALLADSVGVALLVVLDTLTPAERLVFVLHDLFAMPFDEIGSIVGRSPAAAKQLASRARRRVRGSTAPSDAGKARQREVVEAFLRAARDGDLEGLLAVLDPDAVIRIDGAARIAGGAADAADTPRELRGASTWAKQFIALSRGLRFVQPALINGSVGLILAPAGKLSRVLTFTFTNAKIARLEVIGKTWLTFASSASRCSSSQPSGAVTIKGACDERDTTSWHLQPARRALPGHRCCAGCCVLHRPSRLQVGASTTSCLCKCVARRVQTAAQWAGSLGIASDAGGRRSAARRMESRGPARDRSVGGDRRAEKSRGDVSQSARDWSPAADRIQVEDPDGNPIELFEPVR
jgi:RNA polymerase sigma factor (sigma-70 family)